MTKDNRPDPDLILSRLSQNKDKERRGRLKIFFGSSAGVGKTYAMLKAGREHSEKELNVLVGIIETHGRPETERLLEGLRILPALEINYRGLLLKELDIDAALTRKPDILLVDELAHSNAPGTRHPKRWNDVVELLDAGIDVYTTLNVQHIESLSDVVASATGVWVKETIPDTIFDLADDVVLVDIDEDDLIQRLHEGKVYVAPGAMTRAAENFFKKSNLGALREIALRRTADRVDATRETDATETSKAAISDKILVCLGADSMAAQLIRTTKRFATALKAPWEAIHVERPNILRHQPNKDDFLGTMERMTERLGGKLTLLRGEDIIEEVMTYAKEKKFTKIVVGKDSRNNLKSLFANLFLNRLIRQSGTIDVYIVTGENTHSILDDRKASLFSEIKLLNYFLTMLLVSAITLPAVLTHGVFTPTDQALFYLIGIVIVAGKFGFGPVLFYALFSAGFFHVFVLEAHHLFTLNDRPYLITFFVMLMTGYIIATQATDLRMQTSAARLNEKKTHDLLALARQLTSTNGRLPVAELVANHIKDIMDGQITVWMINADGHPSVVLGDLPQLSYYKEFGALEWCLENNQMSGRNTPTLPSAGGIYFPLSTSKGTVGVIGFFSSEENKQFSHADITTLETLADLLATALSRVRAEEMAQQVLLEKATEQLNSSYINSVSEHFKFTPKNEAEAVISSKKYSKETFDTGLYEEVSTILDRESGKLNHSINKVLQSRSLDQSSNKFNLRPTSLLDQVQHVLTRLIDPAKDFELQVNIPKNLPDIIIDTSMIEQVLITFLTDAFSKATLGSHIQLSTVHQDNNLKLSITLSSCKQDSKKYNQPTDFLKDLVSLGKNKDDQIALSVAMEIVRLHNGQSGVNTRPDGTMEYFMTLPIA